MLGGTWMIFVGLHFRMNSSPGPLEVLTMRA
jgi:hypothetical protein